jgi:hypothetical protein
MERFTDQEWVAGVAEMTGILQQRAASRSMITYGDLSKELQSVRIAAHDEAMNLM